MHSSFLTSYLLTLLIDHTSIAKCVQFLSESDDDDEGVTQFHSIFNIVSILWLSNKIFCSFLQARIEVVSTLA